MFIFRRTVKPVRRAPEPRYSIAPEFAVYPIEKQVATGRTIGGFAEVEGTGEYLSTRVRIRTDHAETIDDNGTRREWAISQLPLTAAALRDVVRQVRPGDLRDVEEIDVEIAAAEAELLRLRKARRAAVARVWDNAEPVAVADVKARAAR